MMKRLLMYLMLLAFALPNAIAGEKTIVINRNEGIYEDGTGVYYCTRDGITMTFSDGLDNVNYLVERNNKIFEINSTNFVIKKITFKCLDNTTADNLDCFYWGPSTMSECTKSPYVPTGTYTYSGYIGTWIGGSTPSKSVKFETLGKPVRFGSVEITIDKEFGDIYEKVTSNDEIQAGQTYALVSQYASKALGKEDYYSTTENLTTFTSTPVALLDNNNKVKVTDEVQLLKLESSGDSSRPWYLKVGDNYLRRRSSLSGPTSGAANGQGYNLHTASSVTSYEQYFRVSISVTGNINQNALIRFEHNSSETAGGKTFAIRHYNGGSLFRDMDYSTNNQYAANQRVYLYKPAQSYEVTTECIPSNGGYITLGGGILTDNQGKNWSQHLDNVTFFVGSADGYGIGDVTITDVNTRAVTVLQPTAASDFGNDYSFEMPANDVKITANFLQPYNIDTICNPTDGGIFNFISGYTDFNGQHKSNEGKTVTFKPVAADGYIFNSVTYTNNGVTTTLTPDANGVYTFVMPGNDVTLTANFEAAHDLYILGTANGEVAWHPYGPKFTFDGVNEKYYIDVYFKGGVAQGDNADPAYGYFSLTKKIDENGIWDNIAGFRLAAENNNTWVADGYTGVALYGDRPNNAFKIKTGVYRIEVNAEMTEMSITEYPLTLTFDPAGGVPGNATVVDPNTVVTISSNLQDLVHAINPNEDPVLFYNTIDNWAHQENDNTREISDIGETTVTGSAALGQYLTVNGSATYEVPGDLYLLGTVNGETVWYPHGPKFAYDETNQQYYIDVYFKGDPTYDNNQGDPYGHFSLTTKISASDNGWDEISGYRLFATQRDYWVENGTTANDCFQTGTDYAFKIPAGVYRITVNKAMNQMTITEYPLTLTFNPVSGSTVAAGDQVTITSNLDDLVHAINPNEVNASFKNSVDGGANWDNDNTATITAPGATTTVNAEANIGYITVTGTANYTVPALTLYSITTQVTPAGSNAGSITAPGSAEADQTVTFTVTDADPSAFTLTGVEVVNSLNQLLTVVDNGNGTYSFTMPNDDVTIYADYERTKYNVTTSWSPADGGEIWLNGVNTPQTISVANGDQVVFGITPAENYRLISLTVLNETTGQEITTTPSGSNEYSFTMPTGNVTITAQFDNRYNIYTECVPEGAGTYTFFNASNQMAEVGKGVMFTVYAVPGYRIQEVTMSYVNENNETVTTTLPRIDGEYDFTMPAADVTLTAYFIKLYSITKQCVPEEGGVINSLPSADVPGSTQSFYMTTNTGYRLREVTMSYVDENDETQTITLTKEGVSYYFTMPAADVTITAYFDPVYRIITECTPPEGGAISGTPYNALENDPISFTVTSTTGYALTDVTISYVDENDVNQLITLTSDETGTYHFTMPGAQVTINANFAHVPYGISAVCIPSEGGSINVASSAYTGDWVTFSVERVPGYEVSSVTVTNNTTGQVTELNPYQSGQYGFRMPDADVTITANFSPISDLYLLGTANGVTEWAPTGPKFTYDIATDTYSLTVYFKGIRDVVGQQDDRYGYFSLTTVVDDDDWDAIRPYRLVPRQPFQGMTMGTAYQLYSTSSYNEDNRFMMSPGVYTLTVPGDKSSVTVTQIPVTVTLTADGVVEYQYTNFVPYGSVVTATSDLDEIVHSINPDEDDAVFTMLYNDHPYESYINDFDTIPGNQISITTEGRTLVHGEAYIGWITPIAIEHYLYHNLHYIDFMGHNTVGSSNVVCDTLVGVWAAERILWAKDLGKKPVEMDYNEFNTPDYGIDVAHMQDPERGWDQSNWIMLDFTDYLERIGITGDLEAINFLNTYVNKEIAPMSIKGFVTYDLTHRMVVDGEPTVLKDAIGYPGYLQDPLELLANPTDRTEPVIYYYNHYTPCNFMDANYIPFGPASGAVQPFDMDWDELVSWIMNSSEFAELHDYDWTDMDSWTDEQFETLDSMLYAYQTDHSFFFVKGKPSEVAHVWGVWRGDDVFDVYEMGVNEAGDTIYNQFDLYGAFKVGGWQYNRLTPSPVIYGKPSGLQSLHENVAYEFHIAIVRPGEISLPEKMMRAPVAKGCDPLEDVYLIYPLDLMGHDNNVTDIPELPSAVTDRTVASVSYYNLMGQESKTPFEGINIVVTRYTDGSSSAVKVLR